ncbi:polysaccharide deacetylase family protein [Halalkalibacillus sediminis]|nr:polysaccharide deacetylase family protein [Halalkalibacillus sediminis]
MKIYFFNWTSLKKWSMLIGLVVLLFTSIHYSSGLVSQQSDPTTQTGAITRIESDKDEVALTFNVAWGDDEVLEILEVLQNHKVRATFFVNGDWALRNEDIAKIIIEDQHEVGLLGFHDDPYIGRSEEYIEEDLKNGSDVLKRLDYEPLTFVRLPDNKFDQTIVEYIEDLGYQVVFWSHYETIGDDAEPEQEAERISSDFDRGEIIVFPASDNLTATSEVVDSLISQKLTDGYSFISLTELLSPANIELRPIN